MFVSVGMGQCGGHSGTLTFGAKPLKTKLYEGGAITASQIKRWDVLA